MNNHDAVRHLEYLRQSLSQVKNPIGFFLSAGCPLAVEMSKDKWPLIPDVKNLTIWVNNELKENVKYKLLLEELAKAGKDINNIEDILSFIRGLFQVAKGGDVRGFNEKELGDLDEVVCKKIVEKMNVLLPDRNTPFHKLSKWISSIDRDIPIEIFTTNYDVLIEQALEDLEVPYFDGFVGARRSFFDLRAVENNLIPRHWTRLWKIHGSINWYQEEVDGQKIVFRSSEINKEAPHCIHPTHLKYEESRKMPFLALIDQLSKFIRQKSSFLIILGYSFNDEHLNNTIINSLKATPTAMVLALMFDTYNSKINKDEIVERYPKAYKLATNQHNLNIFTFDKAIIGTNVGEWKEGKSTEEQEIKQFIETKKKDEKAEEIETKVKMGDFSVFSDFLKILIGAEKE
mgnify:CR=1 FL=1